MVAAARADWAAGVAFGMALSEAALFVGLLAPALRVLRDEPADVPGASGAGREAAP